MPVAQQCVPVKKLSALAQLVAIYAERGITSITELCLVTGYSRRAVCYAKKEAGCTAPRCTQVQPASLHPAALAASPSPLKKKGLPHTPSKEKIHPSPQAPPGELLESPKTVGASATENARESKIGEDSRQQIDQQQIDLAGRILKLTPEQALRVYQTAVETHGRKITNSALAELRMRLDAGEDIRKPTVIFARMCADQAGKPKPAIPWGAIVLDCGAIVSRW